MKIFIETADIDEIQEAIATGVVDGFTTNPSLVKKAQEKHKPQDMKGYVKQVLKATGIKPVFIQVTETYHEGMKLEAYKIKKLFGGLRSTHFQSMLSKSFFQRN